MNIKKIRNIDHIHYTITKLPHRTAAYGIPAALKDGYYTVDEYVICCQFVRKVLKALPKWITFELSKLPKRGWKKAKINLITSYTNYNYPFPTARVAPHGYRINDLTDHPDGLSVYTEVHKALLELGCKTGDTFYYRIKTLK